MEKEVKNKKRRVMIETGHFYRNPGLEEECLHGYQIGQKYAEKLSGSGEKPQTVLFIDDINNENTKIGGTSQLVQAKDLESFTNRFVSQYDHVFYESQMLAPAEKLALAWAKAEQGIAKVRRARKTMNGSDPSICLEPEQDYEYQLSVSGVKIGTCDDKTPNMVKDLSCAMLDYAFLAQKAALAPHQVVILPETYREQQAKVQKLIAKQAIAQLVSLTNVFFQDGQIVETKEYCYGN